MKENAYILRLGDRENDAIRNDVVGVGWAKAKELNNETDWTKFKDIIRNAYPDLYEGSPRSLGNAAGSLYTFIHNIKKGDYIVTPVLQGFYVSTIIGEAVKYDDNEIANDFAWRRDVIWRSNKPIARYIANNHLQKRMKARQTCVVQGTPII